MSCRDCLNRRDFLVRSAGAAAAVASVAALGGCGDGVFGPPVNAPPLPAAITVKLSDYPALATVGQVVGFPDALRAVVRTSSSPQAFLGLRLLCTHQGCTTQVTNNEFDCPCHGSRFDHFGNVLQGPAASPLIQRQVTDNGDGTITIA
jgi:Rieske Fe-S protein